MILGSPNFLLEICGWWVKANCFTSENTFYTHTYTHTYTHHLHTASIQTHIYNYITEDKWCTSLVILFWGDHTKFSHYWLLTPHFWVFSSVHMGYCGWNPSWPHAKQEPAHYAFSPAFVDTFWDVTGNLNYWKKQTWWECETLKVSS